MDPSLAEAIFRAKNINVMRSPAHQLAAALSPTQNAPKQQTTLSINSKGADDDGVGVIKIKFDEIYRATPIPMSIRKLIPSSHPQPQSQSNALTQAHSIPEEYVENSQPKCKSPTSEGKIVRFRDDKTEDGRVELRPSSSTRNKTPHTTTSSSSSSKPSPQASPAPGLFEPSMKRGRKQVSSLVNLLPPSATKSSTSSSNNGRGSSAKSKKDTVTTPGSLYSESPFGKANLNANFRDSITVNMVRTANVLTQTVEKKKTKPKPKSKLKEKVATKIDKSKKYDDQGIEEQDDDLCACCLEGTVYDDNNIIYCDGCDVPVHQQCYGITQVPEGSWLCNPCNEQSTTALCDLCKRPGGALRSTDVSGKWVHVLCASWMGEIKGIGRPETEPFTLSKLDRKRFGLKCIYCATNHLACVQCSFGRCVIAAHPQCAFNSAKGFINSFVCPQHESKQSSLNETPKKARESSSKSFGSNRDWSPAEKILLYQIHASVPINAINFWEIVAQSLKGRTAEECQQQWFQSLDNNAAVQKKSKKEKVLPVPSSVENTEVESSVSIKPPKQKRVDRATMQRIARSESKAERGDDLFDVSRAQQQVSVPSVARAAVGRALANALAAGDDLLSDEDEQPPSGVDAPPDQVNWKASYAHKLSKRGKWNELDIDPDDGKADVTTYSKRSKRRKFVQGNVTAAMSPSGRVKVDVHKDSDDSDLPEDEDYDDW